MPLDAHMICPKDSGVCKWLLNRRNLIIKCQQSTAWHLLHMEGHETFIELPKFNQNGPLEASLTLQTLLHWYRMLP